MVSGGKLGGKETFVACGEKVNSTTEGATCVQNPSITE